MLIEFIFDSNSILSNKTLDSERIFKEFFLEPENVLLLNKVLEPLVLIEFILLDLDGIKVYLCDLDIPENLLKMVFLLFIYIQFDSWAHHGDPDIIIHENINQFFNNVKWVSFRTINFFIQFIETLFFVLRWTPFIFLNKFIYNLLFIDLFKVQRMLLKESGEVGADIRMW